VAKIRWQHRATLQNYKTTWTSLLTNEKSKSTFTRQLLHPLTWALLLALFKTYMMVKTSKKGGTIRHCYGKCWSKLLLTKQTFDLFFCQSCDIKSEFSYIICSYLRRLVIQNSLTLQIFFDSLPNPIGIFYLKLRSIYRTVVDKSNICVAFSRRNMYMQICSTVQLYIDS
jgi:hypothetical protein